MMIPASIGASNPLTVKGPYRKSTKYNIKAFTTSENRPSVITYAGSANITTSGRITALTTDKIVAAINSEVKLS